MDRAVRKVRAAAYAHLIDTGVGPDASGLAQSTGLAIDEVRSALAHLEAAHLLALVPGEDRVMMAHPFSGIPTAYEAVVGDRSWYANCAWDSLAILAIMGDGEARLRRPGGTLVWQIDGGVVRPDGFIHLMVPARRFWDDIAFT